MQPLRPKTAVEAKTIENDSNGCHGWRKKANLEWKARWWEDYEMLWSCDLLSWYSHHGLVSGLPRWHRDTVLFSCSLLNTVDYLSSNYYKPWNPLAIVPKCDLCSRGNIVVLNRLQLINLVSRWKWQNYAQLWTFSDSLPFINNIFSHISVQFLISYTALNIGMPCMFLFSLWCTLPLPPLLLLLLLLQPS